MLKKLRKNHELFWIIVKLHHATTRHPSETHVYGMYNKDRSMFYTLIDDEIYEKPAEDVHPLEIFPVFYLKNIANGVFRLSREYLTFKD